MFTMCSVCGSDYCEGYRCVRTQTEAKTLRRCAKEIEDGLRNREVKPEELVAWYRAQADNLDPPLTLPPSGPKATP